MTGAMCVMAAGGPYSGGGGSALSVVVNFTGGDGPFNVSGASGDLYTQGHGVIFPNTAGGTPPYLGPGVSLSDNPSGKIFIVAASDGVHNTLGWSGFAVNETEYCVITNSDRDSAGAHASADYPSSGVLVIKRTS